MHELLDENRLVTLTGAGGAGKTRLAIQVAGHIAGEFADGIWCVDLAPITDPDLVPVTTARALGLPDQPGRSTMDTLTRFVADRQMLVVLDNCEHLLDASAALVVAKESRPVEICNCGGDAVTVRLTDTLCVFPAQGVEGAPVATIVV